MRFRYLTQCFPTTLPHLFVRRLSYANHKRLVDMIDAGKELEGVEAKLVHNLKIHQFMFAEVYCDSTGVPFDEAADPDTVSLIDEQELENAFTAGMEAVMASVDSEAKKPSAETTAPNTCLLYTSPSPRD